LQTATNVQEEQETMLKKKKKMIFLFLYADFSVFYLQSEENYYMDDMYFLSDKKYMNK